MINKICWKQNNKAVEAIKKIIGPEYISQFEEISINLNENNIIYSTDKNNSESLNNTGKSLIFYSLQYVLGEHISSDSDSLVNSAMGTINRIRKGNQVAEDVVAFTFDIEVFYTHNHNDYSLKRKIKYNTKENGERFIQCTEKWLLKNIQTNETTSISREMLYNDILPQIFLTWPRFYGFTKLSPDSNAIKTYSFNNISVHHINQFLYKKQYQKGDRTSAPSFLEKYPFWNEVMYKSVMYSIFAQERDDIIWSNNTRYGIQQYNDMMKDAGETKIKLEILKRNKKNIEKYKKSPGVDKDSIMKIKKIQKEMDDIAKELNPLLNDIFENSDKTKFDFQDEMDKLQSSNSIPFKEFMSLKSKDLFFRYVSALNKLKDEYKKNKLTSSSDLIMHLLNDDYIQELESEINSLEDKKFVYKHKKYFDNLVSKEVKNIKSLMFGTQGQSGSTFTTIELNELKNILDNSERKFPYILVDGVHTETEEREKINDLVNIYVSFIEQEKKFEQSILSMTSTHSVETFKSKLNSLKTNFIKLDSMFFKDKIENKNINQK